ncbi:12878_t:CDS:2 [Racocetra fulgida]|uniref:12878_t:CDS:1 n=1 Tax=Racocetra fulgida TaxID=60492 RepID=A0A9N8WQT2_9GLOM|nr:12878_t:CDS:2 [Racocetra fulgida]
MNLSAKEKRALATARELIKKLDNKIFHVFEDGGSPYGIIGSKKFKYEDDLPEQITDEFDMEFKCQEEFADFLLTQIETKERKFSLGQYKKI